MVLDDDDEPIMAWLDDQRPAMEALLERIVNTDSGSFDHAGVNEVGAIIKAHLEDRGIATKVIERPNAGFCLLAMIDAKHDNAGNQPILLMGHRDTTMVSRVYSHIAKNPDFLRKQAVKAAQ